MSKLVIEKRPLRRALAYALIGLGWVLVYLGNVVMQIVAALNHLYVGLTFANWREFKRDDIRFDPALTQQATEKELHRDDS